MVKSKHPRAVSPERRQSLPVVEVSEHVMQMFKLETIGNIQLITLEIESLDSSNSGQVGGRLSEAMRAGGPIIVDLGALRYFDVAGFASILGWITGRPRGSEVHLCSRNGGIQALFELLRANSVVPLYQSREAALALFRRREMQHAVAENPQSKAASA